MSAHVYVIDRKAFVHCNQMSSESEVFSPSPHISSLSSLICLFLLHWCLPYYLWFGLSGSEYLIMLKMPHFHSLKALFIIPLLSSYLVWHLVLAGRWGDVPRIVHTSMKKDHPYTDTHLWCTFCVKLNMKGYFYAHRWKNLCIQRPLFNYWFVFFGYPLLWLRLACLDSIRDFRLWQIFFQALI